MHKLDKWYSRKNYKPSKWESNGRSINRNSEKKSEAIRKSPFPIFWDYVIVKIMEISSASTYDYIAINGHMKYMFKKDKCDNVVSSLRERLKACPDVEDRISSFKNVRGCNVVTKRTIARIENIKYNTCLCSIEHPLMNQLQTMANLYDKGTLPFDGSLMDQPARAIELIELTSYARQREINEQRRELNG